MKGSAVDVVVAVKALFGTHVGFQKALPLVVVSVGSHKLFVVLAALVLADLVSASQMASELVSYRMFLLVLSLAVLIVIAIGIIENELCR